MDERITTGIVPVYLPDRTIIGHAKLIKDAEGLHAEIHFNIEDSAAITKAFIDDCALSVVYLNNEARDAIDAARKEKKEDE